MKIVDFSGVSIDEDRALITQKFSCMVRIIAVFIIKNIEFIGNRVLYIYGSNDEKMSDIIQDLRNSLKTLKVFSLINLKSYGLIKESHVEDSGGFKMKYRKYIEVNTWPMVTYGSSTGRPPIHVKIAHDDAKIQNINWFSG